MIQSYVEVVCSKFKALRKEKATAVSLLSYIYSCAGTIRKGEKLVSVRIGLDIKAILFVVFRIQHSSQLY